MNRSTFLKSLLMAPWLFGHMKLNALDTITSGFKSTPKMPLLFVGHGHPMNALFDNSFTQTLHRLGQTMERPQAIMVISAHWETRGSFVSVNPHPKAIYDFGGFAKELFEVQYAPPGAPALAKSVMEELPIVQPDPNMGLDHGAWTVLKHIYPNADIPVFQLSIDYTQPIERHFELAQALKKLRNKGVLIMGSGNIVHNLGRLDWHNIDGKTESWAQQFDHTVKQKLGNGDFNALVQYKKLGPEAMLAVPTEDHYLPMIYMLGLADNKEPLKYIYEGFQYGNISMRCFTIG